MTRLADRLTPVTPAEVLAALGRAWSATFGETPRQTSLLVLLSQWALETGRGSAMHCYNLGNVKSNQRSGDWCFFRCDEIIGGKVVWFDPDDPGCCFRAFTTLDAGATDYLGTLRERFSAAWPAVLAGDPAAFSHLLKVSHYYTADETQYTKTLVSIFDEFTHTLATAAPATAQGAAKPLPDLYTTTGVQTALRALGFDPGAVDGIDGPNTLAAVRAFQRAHGLVPDGIVGRLTTTALASAWNAAASAATPRS